MQSRGSVHGYLVRVNSNYSTTPVGRSPLMEFSDNGDYLCEVLAYSAAPAMEAASQPASREGDAYLICPRLAADEVR